MRGVLVLAPALFLSACGGEVKESDEAAIANQAESLERAANATTDQMIHEIENDAKAEEAVDTAVKNSAQP